MAYPLSQRILARIGGAAKRFSVGALPELVEGAGTPRMEPKGGTPQSRILQELPLGTVKKASQLQKNKNQKESVFPFKCFPNLV